MHTLFCRYLSSLGIAHTASYSDMRYRTMPFHTLFGLASLLEEYDAACTGLRISDKSRMGSLPLPYLAQYKGEMVIVERYDNDPATGEISRITIDRDGKRLSLSRERFESGWSGIALFCEKRTDSREPDLAKHRLAEWISAAKTIALFGCLLFLILAVWIRGPLVGNAGAWCAGTRLRHRVGQQSLDSLRHSKLERGRDGLFLGQRLHSHRLSGSAALPRAAQRLLPTLHNLERDVSESRDQKLVYALPDGAGHSLAPLRQLSACRGMARPSSARLESLATACGLYRRHSGSQPTLFTL